MFRARTATNDERSALPTWLRSSSVAWVGGLLTCVVLVLTASFLLREEGALEISELQSAELYARVLQDHAERTFNTVDIAMASLAETIDFDTRAGDDERAGRDLARALNGLPFLRSLSLVTGEGRVLASSSAANLGVVVDLAAVPLPAPGAADALGSSVAGRDLADVRQGRPPGAAPARTFVPLSRSLARAGGPPLFLVAVINPDFFANEYELTLADTTRAAGVFSIRGVVLAATANVRAMPGDDASRHRFFTEFLPARESGSFIGAGIDGTKVVTAFRVLRKRPIVIVVERDHASIATGFRRTEYRALGVCAGVLLAIAAMMVMGWRSLRGHEAVSAALEATRVDVAASERDLRALVESVHELIVRADAGGNIVFLNARWAELLGRPLNAILGCRLSDLCREDERTACDELFAASRSRAETTMLHVQGAAGRPLTLELSVSPVRDSDGTTVGFVGFAVDVSQREAARQALQSQLKFTAQLLEVSPTPIFVKDERGRFVTVNRAWLELMNLTPAQVLGRNSAELFGPDAAKHNDHDARLLLTEERVSYENRLVVADRPARDTVVSKVRFTRADGSAAGIVGSIVDVTEFREAERNIRKAKDAAERANRAKSEFIANISHELRTPLQGIIGFSEVGRDLSSDLPDFLEVFGDILVGGRRMLTLVNGLLDVAQMDSAAGSLPMQRVDLVPLIREAVDQLRPLAQARGISFELQGFAGAVEGDVDRVRFAQAVGNVLHNAVRYSLPRGVIDVSLIDQGHSGIELTVRDRGPGIPADELELVFEAFVQSSRTRDGSGGTGLGLTIARKIIGAHGGSVVAANADGGGALVRMTLPAAGVVSGARPEPSRQDVDGLLCASEVN